MGCLRMGGKMIMKILTNMLNKESSMVWAERGWEQWRDVLSTTMGE